MSKFFGLKDQLKKISISIIRRAKTKSSCSQSSYYFSFYSFADEPTGALDSKSSQELLQCLSQMNEQFNTTIIMVTHDAFAASYCKRILFLKDGKIHARIDKDSTRKEFFLSELLIFLVPWEVE